jgi:general secretion pathway protein G
MKTNRDGRRSGFTLVEVLLVLAIIAGIAALLVPRLFEAKDEAKMDQTRIGIAKVMGALARYTNKLDYPTTEQGLDALVTKPTFDNPEKDKMWFGPYCSASDLVDAWGTKLSYKLEEVTDSSGKTRQVPHLYSFGPNKTDENGEGDDIKDHDWQSESAATK